MVQQVDGKKIGANGKCKLAFGIAVDREPIDFGCLQCLSRDLERGRGLTRFGVEDGVEDRDDSGAFVEATQKFQASWHRTKGPLKVSGYLYPLFVVRTMGATSVRDVPNVDPDVKLEFVPNQVQLEGVYRGSNGDRPSLTAHSR